ncbi:MAG: helix-turn-helix transcriptional regulator [Micromonosporaceae bacterium]
MSNGTLGRLLRLLGLLQTRREWSGTDLAAQLEVTSRTVRRDVDRLRELGYPIAATAGQTGGYRLTRGDRLPPLLLDNDEAVAIAVALAAGAGASYEPQVALRAMAKLAPVLPARFREHLTAMGAATVPLAYGPSAPHTDPALLATLAAARRDHEIIGYRYQSRHGTASDRRVEPHSLVAAYGRWYLVAYDTRAEGWRTFRADRISDPRHTRHHFPERDLPAPDPATFLAQHLANAPYRYTARVTVHAPAEVVQARTGALPARVTPLDENTCAVNVSDDSLERITQHLVALGADFALDTVPPELRDQLHSLAGRLTRAAADVG